jgi:hypothetical protein
MDMHNVTDRVRLKQELKPQSKIIKRAAIDTIQLMIGYSLYTFKIADKTKIGIDTDTNLEDYNSSS